MKSAITAIGFTAFGLMVYNQAIAGPFLPQEMSGKSRGWFFNKPNISLDEYDSDLEYCHGLALKSHEKAKDATDGGLMLDIVEGLAGSKTQNADTANCMAEKNYRLFELPDTDLKQVYKKLEAMNAATRKQYVSSATPPKGQLIEARQNGMLDETKTTVRAAGHLAPSDPEQTYHSNIKYGFVYSFIKKKLSPRPFTEPVSLLPGKATIVAKLSFDGEVKTKRQYPGLLFFKHNPETSHVMMNKSRPISFRIAHYKDEEASLINSHQIFQIEPGQYILWALISKENIEKRRTTGFCISSLAIQVEAGETLNMGHWHIDNEGLLSVTQDNLSEAGSALTGFGDASSQLQNAKYYNGAQTTCSSIVAGTMPNYYIRLPE